MAEELHNPQATDVKGRIVSIHDVHLQGDGLFYIPAMVHGVQTNFLFDTGATYTLIDKSVYDQMNHPPALRPCNGKLYGVNGSYLRIHGAYDAEVNMAGTGQMIIHDCVVADLYRGGCIFGLREMVNNGIILDLERHVMKLNGQLVALHYCDSDGDYPVTVVAKEDSIIPAGISSIVNAVCSDIPIEHLRSGSKMFSPTNDYSLSESVVFAPHILVKGEQLNIGIPICNVTNKEMAIKKGTLMGLASLVETEDLNPETGHVNVILSEQGVKPELPEHLQPLLKNISAECDDYTKEEITKLLIDYEDVFVGPKYPIGQTHLVEHTIDTGDHQPIKLPPRRQSSKSQDQSDEAIKDQLSKGVIRPSDSSWAFREVLVRKKDGTTRFCIDYRLLNAITKKDAYPLPRLDDSLDAMGGAVWFCTLDLASGYWQVPLAEKDKGKTAFATRSGLYEYNVMPFGLTNAPATFERLMDRTLRGLTWRQCLVYLDDVIVFGKDIDETIGNLKDVFKRFRKANLRLKPKKCALFQTEVPFLGHIVSRDGVRTDPVKVETIVNWPHPESVKEIQGFLGLCGYYRRFVRGFSTIAAALVALTRKDSIDEDTGKVNWTEEVEESFISLKKAIVDSVALKYVQRQPPECSLEQREGLFILDTDASNFGIGGAVHQIQDGIEVPLSFGSKTLSKTQRGYCTTYRELLAVVHFAKHFKHYLYGQKVIIRTDHSSLRWLMTFNEAEGMVLRWNSQLKFLDVLAIEYREGKKHINADSLSRRPSRNCPRHDCPHCRMYWQNPSTPKVEKTIEVAVPEPDAAMVNVVTRRKNYDQPQEIETDASESCYDTEEERDPEPIGDAWDCINVPPETGPFKTAQKSSPNTQKISPRTSERLAKKQESGTRYCSYCRKNNCEHTEKLLVQVPKRSRKLSYRLPEENVPEEVAERVEQNVQEFDRPAGRHADEPQENPDAAAMPRSAEENSQQSEVDTPVTDEDSPGSATEADKEDAEVEQPTQLDNIDQWWQGYTPEQLAKLQDEDPDLRVLREQLSTLDERPTRDEAMQYSSNYKALLGHWSSYQFHDDVLYRHNTNRKGDVKYVQLVVPAAIRKELFFMLHNHVTAGHLGYSRCHAKLRDRFWWPSCKKDLYIWLEECESCGRVKMPSHKHQAPLTQVQAGAPWERIAMDLVGPFKLTPRKMEKVLVVSCYFTKYVEAIPIENGEARTVAMALCPVFARLGLPKTIHTDRGGCFSGAILTELCKILQIGKTLTTAYRPQSDGLVERCNRTLQDMLTHYCEGRDDWDITIHWVMAAYRSTVHESTKYTPNMLMFNRETRMPIDMQYPAPDGGTQEYQCITEYVEWLREKVRDAHEVVRENLQLAAIRQKRNYDHKTVHKQFVPGEWVYVKDHVKLRRKLTFNWKPAHLVLQRMPSQVNYRVQLDEGTPPEIKHVDDLKAAPGCQRTPWASSGVSLPSSRC